VNDGAAGTARLFVALPLPPELARGLADRAGALLDERSWRLVRSTEIHLTLRFLGATPRERIPGIVRELRRVLATLVAPELELDGIGVFPGLRRPRVLWAGVRERPGSAGRLAATERAVGSACTAEDVGGDERREAWNPHVTLARARDGARAAVPDKLEAWRPEGLWRADRVVLFESLAQARHSDPRVAAGAGRHLALAEFPLAGS
jgi:2'-5' RNA ligase